MWGISLFIIGIVTVTNVVLSLLRIESPDILVRFMGVITIIALPFFAYSAIKIRKNDKR